MNQATPQNDSSALSHAPLNLDETEALCNSLKHVTVRSGDALDRGDAMEGIAQLERWVESYRRGLSAAQKISSAGVEMLQATRDKLAYTLEERLRLDDEGGNAPSPEQIAETNELAQAVKRVDRLLTTFQEYFQPAAGASTDKCAA